MRIAFDIDGTICDNTNGKYAEAHPYKEMIEFINSLYDDGHYIIMHTARGVGRFDGNISKIYNKWYLLTTSQLSSWGVKYHELYLGKILADLYVDDKCFEITDDGTSVKSLKEHIKKLNKA